MANITSVVLTLEKQIVREANDVFVAAQSVVNGTQDEEGK